VAGPEQRGCPAERTSDDRDSTERLALSDKTHCRKNVATLEPAKGDGFPWRFASSLEVDQ
jgi:hypothetical protein